MDREALAWALLLSVPVGVGITGYAAHVIREDVINPLSILTGLAATVVIFAIMAYAFSRGSADEEYVGDRTG